MQSSRFQAGRAAALAAVLAACAGQAPAQFSMTEVSEPGSAMPFLVTDAGWSWEDVGGGATYSVYRSDRPDGGFECILDMHPSPTWAGDPTDPQPGGVLHYLVTAFDGVDDNLPGTRSDGTPRTLDVPCPRAAPCPSGTPVPGRVPLRLVQLMPNFTAPMFLTSPPGDPRLFVLERAGRIRIHHPDGRRTTFLDFSAAPVLTHFEAGALGLAFHPDYATNGRFYVHYSTNLRASVACPTCAGMERRDHLARISEFTVSADPDVALPATERVILEHCQPYGNHNGGWIDFGPDGYLYIAFGDGGSGGDPCDSGQSLNTLLGKILRIDVDGGMPYAVPPDNPFITTPGARWEIWAYGLRNPWRNAFDRATGDLYIADVGQNAWEEVDVATAASGRGRGLNYGWRVMEGASCFAPMTGCDMSGKVLPDHEYSHARDGCSITGGYVYRGCRMPDWNGFYFFADYCNEWLDVFDYSGGVGATYQRLMPPGTLNNPVSFGEDAAGELYIVMQGGGVFRIEPN